MKHWVGTARCAVRSSQRDDPTSEYAAPTGLCSSPNGWERMPKAGEGFSFFFCFYKYAAPTALGTNAVPKSFCVGRLGHLAFESIQHDNNSCRRCLRNKWVDKIK